ncbi:MAG: YIP1 family protein [Bdellovibrio sp.]|nr:YIP1 family protein [Bdellovibrio sp.]
MRDVSQRPKKVDLKQLVQFLIEFIKHPVHKISTLPDWNWPSLFVVQVLLAVVSGSLAGLIKLNFYRIASGMILMPIISTIAALLLALFLYYYFQFFENRTEDYRKIFTLVILSSIPFYLFQVLSEYFAPVTLIGFAFTALLAIVGLCENFNVSRKRAYQLIGILVVLVLAAWILNRATA